MNQRQATWHLRAPGTPERERFTRFCIEHGWTKDGGSTDLITSDRIFRRGDQKLVAEFFGRGFSCAWLHASEHHRGVMISDHDTIASFVTEPQSWAIAHAEEWLSEHEAAVMERRGERG